MKRTRKDRYDWGEKALKIMRERSLSDMKGPVCRCKCHRDGDEDHRECCFFTAARERDVLRGALQQARELLDCDWPPELEAILAEGRL